MVTCRPSSPFTVNITPQSNTSGMLALIGFESTVDVREFLENEKNRIDTFKWMKMGSPEVKKFELVTWIRIVGLPLKL